MLCILHFCANSPFETYRNRDIPFELRIYASDELYHHYMERDQPPHTLFHSVFDSDRFRRETANIIFNNVFYTFTAPTTGFWEFQIANPTFVWRMAVYDGDSCPVDPTLVISCATLLTITIELMEGNRYLIEVGGRDAMEEGTGELSVVSVPPPPPPIPFIRGDVDGDGNFNGLVDGVAILRAAFVVGSSPVPCRVAGDFNGDGVYSGLVDGLGILNYAFIPGTPPPALPFPDCGVDPVGFPALGCDVAPLCSPSPLPNPDPNYVLSLSSTAAGAGRSAEISASLSFVQGEDISGIAFGVCADPLNDVDIPCVGGGPLNDCIDTGTIVQGSDLGAVNGGLGAQFFAPFTTAQGWVVGVVIHLN